MYAHIHNNKRNEFLTWPKSQRTFSAFLYKTHARIHARSWCNFAPRPPDIILHLLLASILLLRPLIPGTHIPFFKYINFFIPSPRFLSFLISSCSRFSLFFAIYFCNSAAALDPAIMASQLRKSARACKY